MRAPEDGREREKTGFVVYYEMIENLKLLGNDVFVEVLSALSAADQGKGAGKLSPLGQFAFSAYLPYMRKATRSWRARVRNGKQGGGIPAGAAGVVNWEPDDYADSEPPELEPNRSLTPPELEPNRSLSLPEAQPNRSLTPTEAQPSARDTVTANANANKTDTVTVFLSALEKKDNYDYNFSHLERETDKEKAKLYSKLSQVFTKPEEEALPLPPPRPEPGKKTVIVPDSASAWEVCRQAWNSRNVEYTCEKKWRDLPPGTQERVIGSLRTYSADQLADGIRAYFKAYEQGRTAYRYRSLYLLVEKGIEYFI